VSEYARQRQATMIQLKVRTAAGRGGQGGH